MKKRTYTVYYATDKYIAESDFNNLEAAHEFMNSRVCNECYIYIKGENNGKDKTNKAKIYL